MRWPNTVLTIKKYHRKYLRQYLTRLSCPARTGACGPLHNACVFVRALPKLHRSIGKCERIYTKLSLIVHFAQFAAVKTSSASAGRANTIRLPSLFGRKGAGGLGFVSGPLSGRVRTPLGLNFSPIRFSSLLIVSPGLAAALEYSLLTLHRKLKSPAIQKERTKRGAFSSRFSL